MNDRLAEGLRKQTSMTNYCGEGELSERIFCGYFEEIFKKEERTGIEIKQKILEFRPSVVRHAVCCNPGALGHSALSSCGAAVYFNNSPAFAGISCSSTPPNAWQHQDSLPGWTGGEDYQRAMTLFGKEYRKLKAKTPFDVNGDIIAQINNLTPDMKQAVLEYSFKKRQQSGEAEGEEWSKLSYYGDSQANLKARDLKQMAFLNKFYGSIFPNKEGLTGANEMLKMSLTLTGALEMDGYTDDLGVYDLLSMNTARKISRMLNGGSEKDLVSCYENSGINFSNGKFEGEAGFLETEAYKVVKSTDPAVKQNWEASWANVKYANEVDLGSKGHDKRGSEILAEFIPQLSIVKDNLLQNPNDDYLKNRWNELKGQMYRRIVESDLKLISNSSVHLAF